MSRKINTLYFSPTGTTEKIVKDIAQKIAGGKAAVRDIDFTLPQGREENVTFKKDDLVIAGVPVYAGRVPNVLLKFLSRVCGSGATAIAVVVYGNRDYDDALLEFKDILSANGFKVVAAGAFIGEHSFSTVLGANRPDEKDRAQVEGFAAKIADKLNSPGRESDFAVKGNRPFRPYYRAKSPDGVKGDFLKAVPKTNSDCIDCKLCAQICPMGSIDAYDVARITGVCIKCCGCVKKCPVSAKYFDDEIFVWHKEELELKYSGLRREPEYFL
jgi:flavodoxin/NAD-dependent dihydropyrimidine dehydrogenase PreA subunit